MIYVLTGVVVAAILLGILAYMDNKQKHDKIENWQQISNVEMRQRIVRRNELKEAYRLAKEELGDEPTVDQIFLTRDTLRDNDGTT